jgi:hypothetical protein
MGQSLSAHAYQVSDPKTPYEWSKDDEILTEKGLDLVEESIQKELEADARHVEEMLLGNSCGYAVVLYGRDILRVDIDPKKVLERKDYKSRFHGVLLRELRVKCLMKYMKIPYTIRTKRFKNGYKTIIQRVLNVENINKPSVSISE